MKKTIFQMLLLFVALSSCKKDEQKSAVAEGRPVIKSNASSLVAATNTLQNQGYTWNVTNSGGGSQGPGPNIFDPSYAWVDANGFLHLKLAKSATDGKYHCAEVT